MPQYMVVIVWKWVRVSKYPEQTTGGFSHLIARKLAACPLTFGSHSVRNDSGISRSDNMRAGVLPTTAREQCLNALRSYLKYTPSVCFIDSSPSQVKGSEYFFPYSLPLGKGEELKVGVAKTK